MRGRANTLRNRWKAICSKTATSKPTATCPRATDRTPRVPYTKRPPCRGGLFAFGDFLQVSALYGVVIVATRHACCSGFGFLELTACRTLGVLQTGMPHVVAANHVDDAFRHVLGMIANAFERTRNEHQFHRLGNAARVFDHVGDHVAQGCLPLLVDFLVTAHDAGGMNRIIASEAVEHV